MDQPYEYMNAVGDPASFIRANIEARPSGLRHLLNGMQRRKINGQPKDKKLLLKELSPSAFERSLNRRKQFGSLEPVTSS